MAIIVLTLILIPRNNPHVGVPPFPGIKLYITSRASKALNANQLVLNDMFLVQHKMFSFICLLT